MHRQSVPSNGQAYEKPRGPIVFVRVAGITRSPLAADRSCIRPGTAATGTHSSIRYDGARLCRHLYANVDSL